MGESISINDREIKAKISSDLEPFADLKLRFDFCLDAHCFDDIYVKNSFFNKNNKRQKDQKLLQITSMGYKDRNILKKWMEQAGS